MRSEKASLLEETGAERDGILPEAPACMGPDWTDRLPSAVEGDEARDMTSEGKLGSRDWGIEPEPLV